jgi:hypothetical protein
VRLNHKEAKKSYTKMSKPKIRKKWKEINIRDQTDNLEEIQEETEEVTIDIKMIDTDKDQLMEVTMQKKVKTNNLTKLQEEDTEETMCLEVIEVITEEEEKVGMEEAIIMKRIIMKINLTTRRELIKMSKKKNQCRNWSLMDSK